jgi:hypothetical protein
VASFDFARYRDGGECRRLRFVVLLFHEPYWNIEWGM